MAEARDFKVGTQLGFAKAHHKMSPIGKNWAWPWAREAPQNVVVSFDIYTMAEAMDFKFGTQLGFSKARHKTTPRGKVGVALG